MPKTPRPFKWKHVSRAEELSLSPDQEAWIVEYLTTAPDVPQLWTTVTMVPDLGETPDDNFKNTERELLTIGRKWDGDGLIRWICQNTWMSTGPKFLTQEGRMRAVYLYQGLPEDALFATPEPLDDSGMGSPSFVHFLRNRKVPEDGWPKKLSPSQDDIIEGYIQDRADQQHGPAKNIFGRWARLMIHEGRLSPTFDAAEFVVLVAKRRKTKQYLTPEALEWVRRATPPLAWNLPQTPDPGVVVNAGQMDARTFVSGRAAGIGPESYAKGTSGRPTKYDKWKVVAFAAELELLEEGYVPKDINEAIFSKLPKKTVENVKAVKSMRDNERKYWATRAATKFLEEYLRQKGFKAAGGNPEVQHEAEQLTITYRWRAYLEGGHRGDWTCLERILNRTLAQHNKKVTSGK